MRFLYYNNRIGLGLSRELWIVQAGIFLNYLGYGAVLPFEIIYLHDERGFGLGTAGLVVGTLTGIAVVIAPLSGPVIDRFGARVTAAGAGVLLAAGYAGLAFAEVPWQAFLVAAVAGVGNGALNPSQSALIASLAERDVRHRATAVSRAASNLGAGIGAFLGGLVAVQGLHGFMALFLANAATYLVYVGILVLLVHEDVRPEPVAGGYRVVLRDRPFLHLALINTALIGVGWGIFTWVVPAYANGELGLGTGLIGLLLLANMLTVAAVQIPAARLLEGRRRAGALAVAAVAYGTGCLLVLGGSVGAAFAFLLVAYTLIALGECLHTTVLMPLTADLAPDALRGRYMATIGLSWWLGLALAPILGTPLLGVSPTAALLIPALVAFAAAGASLALERRLPAGLRLTPRPGDLTTDDLVPLEGR